MSIRIVCESCQTKYRLADEDAGRSFSCPECGHRLHVPAALSTSSPANPESAATKEKAEQPEPLMKPTKKIDFEDLIDMTAMVDIVFFLLIFFLVTSLTAVDSAIDLPKPGGKQGTVSSNLALPEDQTQQAEITVRIDRADRITVEGNEVRGPDELFVRLRELRGGPGRPTVLMVVGSGDATHGTLVSVLDSGNELGFEKIKLSVAEDGDSEAGSP